MKKETVAVVGLGYVGLPLACLCAEKGYRVKGFDLSKKKVDAVNKGVSPIKDKALQKKLHKLKGKIVASTKPRSIREAKIVIVCVPTPALRNKPDLQPLRKASKTIARQLRKGQLVIIESTVYPGTVEEVVRPILEKSGLKIRKDFFLVHCPERIDPGNKQFSIEIIPRVLGALSKKGERKSLRFYKSLLKTRVLVLSSVKAAEAVKVVENTFRDINIAFVNELAKSFDRMGIDISEVIRGASTKPFGFMPFYPGPGVGGHCIAQDPYYLIARAERSGFEPRFLRIARKLNESMPHYVVQRAGQALKELGLQLKGAKIAVLGIAYKPGVDDARESPGLKIVSLLRKKGARIATFDPFIPKKSTAPSLAEAVKGSKLVILATHHKQLVGKLSASFLKKMGVKAVLDTRHALNKERISKAGILYKGIGR